MAVFIYNDKKYLDAYIKGEKAFSFYADTGTAYSTLKQSIGKTIALSDGTDYKEFTLCGVSLSEGIIYLCDNTSKRYLSFTVGERFPDNCVIYKTQISNSEAKGILSMGSSYITNSRRLFDSGPKIGTNDYSHKILAIEYALDVNIKIEFTSAINRIKLHDGDILLVAKFSSSNLDKLYKEPRKERQEKLLANSIFRFEKYVVKENKQ